MKTKLVYLLVFFACLFFKTPAHCEAMANDYDWEHSYVESAIPNCLESTSEAYRYISVGVGPIVLIPSVGVGYRKRYSQFGWDSSLNFSTIGFAHQVSGHLVGHYYLNPLQKNSMYLGLGLMGSRILSDNSFSRNGVNMLSSDFVVGKALEANNDSNQFIEMHVGIVTATCFLETHKRSSCSAHFPLVYIKYGMQF